MAHYPREEDLFIGNTFVYANIHDRGTAFGAYAYGHEYEIIDIRGEFPDNMIDVRLADDDSGHVTTSTEYLFTFFVYLNDEEKFAMLLARDARVADITITNGPMWP